MTRKRTILLVIPFAALLLAACDYNNLIADAKEFDKLVATGTASLKKTYLGINDYYRKTYIAERRFNPEEKVWVRDDHRNYTALVFKIDPAEIQARELMLQGLAEYSAGLAAIAGSDAPEKASELVSQLSARLTNTASSLASIKKSPSTGSKPFNIAAYSGPISNLARIAAKYWVRNMQKNYLKQSIIEGEPLVSTSLDLLEQDLDNIFDAAYQENAELTLLAQQNYYNRAYTVSLPQRLPEETDDDFRKRVQQYDEKAQALLKDRARLDFLSELSAGGKELADLKTASPLPLIRSLRAAHATIRRYVDKPDVLKDKTRGVAYAVTGVLRGMQSN